MAKLPTSKSSGSRTVNVDQFLAEVDSARPPATRQSHRLIFAMDATASREPSWDLACSLHAELFQAAQDAGNMAVQLAYYRGIDEFSASPWSTTPAALLDRMQRVRCLGGRTQILKLLRHATSEARRHPLKAIVFVGDCFEENAQQVVRAAGELALYGVPVFVFQEGRHPSATEVFKTIAALTGGAHVPFRPGSADDLRDLLRAVATFASAGRSGLERLTENSMSARLLTQVKTEGQP